ncbi:MAG: cyclic nucleotide-binding domain-containing protein [bacterium]
MTAHEPARLKVGPVELEWLAGALLFSDQESTKPDFEKMLSSLPSVCLLRYQPGIAAVREGDEGKDFFVVYSGSLSVSKRKKTGRMVRIGRLWPGDFFGEISFLMGSRRSATVRTLEACKLFRFSAAELAKVLSRNKPLENRMRRLAHERLEKIFVEGL